MTQQVQPFPPPDDATNHATLQVVGEQLLGIERSLVEFIRYELTTSNIGRDRAICDAIFGKFTHAYLVPCLSQGLGSRAAQFSREHLVPEVLRIEQQQHTECHKGALFYDTGLAHLLSGNEDGYEYFLAMTDEEELRTNAATHTRGSLNLRGGGIMQQTLTGRLSFACDLLNGVVAGGVMNYAFVTGFPPVTAGAFDTWRQSLDLLHQFELLRIVHDVEVFVGRGFPDYPASRDNPAVLLRLAKGLSHLAQWVESCLTQWQGPSGRGGALSPKLIHDADFGSALSNAAGSQASFAGNSPHGAVVDSELRQLLADLATAGASPQRSWRILRILYIVRNATAHTIEPALALYQDRALLLTLIQVVFTSVFVIAQLKARPMP
jgi:hypothetical protein